MIDDLFPRPYKPLTKNLPPPSLPRRSDVEVGNHSYSTQPENSLKSSLTNNQEANIAYVDNVVHDQLPNVDYSERISITYSSKSMALSGGKMEVCKRFS